MERCRQLPWSDTPRGDYIYAIPLTEEAGPWKHTPVMPD